MGMEEIIEGHVKSGRSPGIAAGLVGRDDGARTFGFGELRKHTGIAPDRDTVFEIGSMTKTFTAVLAARLQQEGLLSLQDPVTKYLPSLGGSEFDRRGVTMFHLLTHTSGINEFPLRTFVPQILSVLIRGKSVIPQYKYDTAGFLKHLSGLELKDPGRADYLYSNMGFGLAGKAMEKLTGSTFGDLVRNRICSPLGMKDTGIGIGRVRNPDRVAAGYSFRNKKADYWDLPAIEAAGSLYSTVSDMARFLGANLGIVRSGLSQALKYCQDTRVRVRMPALSKILPRLFGIHLSGFCLGWSRTQYSGMDVLGHDGGTEGFTSFMGMNPGNQTAVVVLTNRSMRPVHKLGLSLLHEMK